MLLSLKLNYYMRLVVPMSVSIALRDLDVQCVGHGQKLRNKVES